MPNEIKKPLDKFANKFGDVFVPKELAKPLMMAGAFIPGPIGYAVSAAGQGKAYGKLDYDALAMQAAMNQTMKQPQMSGPSGNPGNLGTSVHSGAQYGTTTSTPLTMTPSTVPTGTYTPTYQAGSPAPAAKGPGFFQRTAEGVGDVRNRYLGDPRDRMLFDKQMEWNPATKSFEATYFNPGDAWTSLGNPWNAPGPMTDAEFAAFKSGATNIGTAGSAQYGMMEQKEIIEDYEKDKEREEARNRDYWQNYFAGIERYGPYREGRMGDEMDALYGQYGAADEYDPYHGMRDAYAGTYFDEDRWYKDGGRVGLQGGGNPHRDVAPRPRRAGL